MSFSLLGGSVCKKWLANEASASDFYSKENSYIAADYLRFAVCKNDDVLELAKTRLRSLKQYIRAD